MALEAQMDSRSHRSTVHLRICPSRNMGSKGYSIGKFPDSVMYPGVGWFWKRRGKEQTQSLKSHGKDPELAGGLVDLGAVSQHHSVCRSLKRMEVCT